MTELVPLLYPPARPRVVQETGPRRLVAMPVAGRSNRRVKVLEVKRSSSKQNAVLWEEFCAILGQGHP